MLAFSLSLYIEEEYCFSLYFIIFKATFWQMIKHLHFYICQGFSFPASLKHVWIFFRCVCFSESLLLLLFFATFQALTWVFVVDTLNFSFWPEREGQQCEVTYKGTTYTGYMTLCAAISRAMDEGESLRRDGYIVNNIWMVVLFFSVNSTVLLNSRILLRRVLFCLSNGFFQKKKIYI